MDEIDSNDIGLEAWAIDRGHQIVSRHLAKADRLGFTAKACLGLAIASALQATRDATLARSETVGLAKEAGVELVSAATVEEALRDLPVEVATERVMRVIEMLGAEVKALVEERSRIGQVMLRHGYAWRAGAEADYLDRALKDEKAAPTVVVTVSGGVAEVRGASKDVHVILVDMEREGEELSESSMEHIMAGQLHKGDSPEDFSRAVHEARESLLAFSSSGPKP